MRAAQRAFVLALAVLLSVIAVPAYAGDDSPGLLETVVKGADAITAPILKPPSSPVVVPADPVQKVTAVVDSAIGAPLTSRPLDTTVDSIVGTLAPEAVVELPDQAAAGPPHDLSSPASATPAGIVVARPAVGAFARLRFPESASARPVSTAPAKSESHVPGTSTLPDGGSSLTLGWLVLAFGVTSAGVAIIRRERCGSIVAKRA